MARRSGKAASRRARQRARTAARRPQPSPGVSAAGYAPPRPTGVEPAPPREPATESTGTAAPRPSASYVSGRSALGERAREEYHYVTRDLRNIAILTAVMAALLAVAAVALPAMGVVIR